MVGYFRKVNVCMILLGAFAGTAAGFLLKKGMITILFFACIGGALGRLACGIWANKQVGKWNEILFSDGEPEKFLKIFIPVLERTRKHTPEYVDGCNKAAYAWEALGDFERAWQYLSAAEPEVLQGKAGLNARTTTYSNRTRVRLLQGDSEGAAQALEALRQVSDAAMIKDKHLGHAGRHYVRLYENWLLVLAEEPADEEFIEEEIRLSGNRIRSSELQLLLARAAESRGDAVLAEELRLTALSTGVGLWAEGKARELLNN